MRLLVCKYYPLKTIIFASLMHIYVYEQHKNSLLLYMDKVAQHLVEARFYNSCYKHEKAETLFCINCLSHPFCENCVADSKHWDHHHLQVRVIYIYIFFVLFELINGFVFFSRKVFKASRKEVVRVKDVENLLNISNIQPFIINNRRVIYIKARETKGDPSCNICGGRKLEDKHEFCSIECQASVFDASLIHIYIYI